MPKATKGGFYAVQRGRSTGVVLTWSECEALTKGFAGSVYKKFPTRQQAEEFVRGSGYGGAPAVSNSAEGECGGVKETTTRIARSEAKSKMEPKPYSRPSASIGSASRLKRRPISSPGARRKIVVYCDGSSIGNGKQGARAGWGVYFSDPDLTHLSESRRLPGPVQTNNRAELMSLIRAIELSPDDGRDLLLLTDSQYSMNCVGSWIKSWKLRDWRTSSGSPVQNKDLIQRLDSAISQRSIPPKLEYVRAHAGIEGNEIVDGMAKFGASLPLPLSDEGGFGLGDHDAANADF
ncbi:hypothetical protein BCV70DRAFT_191006 [Testicularia cyperi]|uniref:Ribonuclease H n=1 Tax=Testicularia cyperi TaxID=1882483 RepID=A0A317XRB2_9BASI|nr:hypothetical protein BCV70DRAFT_191006 [Testicularia cyperi]